MPRETTKEIIENAWRQERCVYAAEAAKSAERATFLAPGRCRVNAAFPIVVVVLSSAPGSNKSADLLSVQRARTDYLARPGCTGKTEQRW